MRKALALAVAATVGVSIAAQQPSTLAQPTFKSSVNAVLLDVRVVDANGQFVRDLTKGDFRIQEDGTKQSISTFEQVDLPFVERTLPTFSGTPVDADIASNENSQGRLYVLMLDDLNMNPQRTSVARAIAREFVEKKLAANDRVVLSTTSGRSDMRLQFTGDRQRLLSAIDKFQAGYGMDRRQALSNSVHSALAALSAMAKWLSVVDGRRKTILFISEGFDAVVPDAKAQWAAGDHSRAFLRRDDDLLGRLGGASTDFVEIAEMAARSNVTVYGIDPIGNPGGPASSVKPGPWLLDDDITSSVGYDAAFTSRSELAALSDITGGFGVVRTNDYDAAFDRIVQESSSYYLLGYVSTNSARDGKSRRVKVTTARPDLTVRTRSGYATQKDKPRAASTVPKGWSTELANVIQSPVQVSGLTMTVGAAAFRGKGKDAQVEIVVETRKPPGFDSADKASEGSVGLAIVVADQDGTIRASHQGTLTMHLQTGTRAAVDDYGVRLLTRLTLAPGHYVMRVGGADAVGSTAGSVHFALDVPDFTKGPLAVSGLLLASKAEGQRPTSGADTNWRNQSGLPPTTARSFAKSDEITVLDEIYNNDSRAPVEATTTVVDEKDREVFRRSETLDAGTHPGRVTIPLRDFGAGNYLLKVEAKSRTNAKASASRQIVFSVQ